MRFRRLINTQKDKISQETEFLGNSKNNTFSEKWLHILKIAINIK